MAAALSLREYLWSFGLGFISFAAGSVLMHSILKPDMSEPDLHDHLTAQRDAIREVEKFAQEMKR